MKASNFSQKASFSSGCGCGHLPQGRSQLGDLFQLEKEVPRIAADRDATVEAA